jgi:pilus assembly protein Flp/PilA
METSHWVQRFGNDEEGVTAIEYGLIAALVAVAIIAGATLLGTNLDALFAAIAGKVATVTSGV